jgi:hypothetical protein
MLLSLLCFHFYKTKKTDPMKNAMKLIPSIPSIPTSPKMPVSPKQSIVSDGESAKTAPASFPATGGGMPAKIKEIIAMISKHTNGNGFGNIDIQKMIREFPLDKYRDENGKICCPVPKETRERIMNSLRKK